MKSYLLDGNNENFSLTAGYQADIVLNLIGLGVADVTGHTFNFDIGVEGEAALLSGTATILNVFDPAQIQLTIPSGTFSVPLDRLVLQIRWTDLTPVERVIYKGFIDVLAAVTPV
jgi:hypothetical protein